jgi:hypothetical protein
MKGVKYSLNIIKNNETIDNLSMNELITKMNEKLNQDGLSCIIVNNNKIFNLISNNRPCNKILKNLFSVKKQTF